MKQWAPTMGLTLDTRHRCPICKRGTLLEWTAGYYCSRRYAPRAPCDFDGGYLEPLAQAMARHKASQS